MIFDGMVQNVNNKVSKFLMYPRVNSPSFSGRTIPLFPTMLVTMGEGSRTPTEPHHIPSPEAQQTSPTATSSSSLPPVTTATIPTDLEISALKARIKHLEDRDGGDDVPSGEDATIKERRLETREEARIERSTDKGSNDTEEMVNVLTSLDAASVLSSRVQVSVPLAAEVASVSVPPATISVPTSSDVVPTASPIFTTATMATPYSRRKGSKEEGERYKRKGLRLEQDSAKKVKSSEEDLNAMMQLVPVEEVYVEALQIVQLILFIIDSGCTKHMTGNLKLLCNFVEKFLGTVRFDNDQFAPILGYGDLVQGNIMIDKVYYVKGLNQNLFSVGQFCDVDLEVAFRKSTCFVRDLQGNDLLTGNPGSDLYTIFEHNKQC
nr:integrase, catalytic region, zinc finger, CCHC-type, peptidase aspartic, catalytic [Tanacetum cinerariifolium]